MDVSSHIDEGSEPAVYPKVAMIEPVGGHSGMDFYDAGLCGGLREMGVDVALFTCDETEAVDGVTVFRPYREIYGDGNFLVRGLRYVRGSLWSIWKARRLGMGLAHFHFFNVGVLELFNVAVARLAGMRCVATMHDVNPLTGRHMPLLKRLAFRFLNGVIVHNRPSQTDLEAGGKLNLPVAMIPHGNYAYDEGEIVSRDEARSALSLPKDGKILLFFGQIKPSKGLDLLVEALPEIAEEHEDAVLVVAGRRAKDLGDIDLDSDQIAVFDHYIPNEEVATFFSAADLVILPYRRIYQSGVLLNSMSVGRAVLVSDLPAMREIITDGKNGFLFRSGDVHDLAERVNQVLGDEGGRVSAEQHAKSYVTKNHSWGQIGKETSQFYRRVLS